MCPDSIVISTLRAASEPLTAREVAGATGYVLPRGNATQARLHRLERAGLVAGDWDVDRNVRRYNVEPTYRTRAELRAGWRALAGVLMFCALESLAQAEAEQRELVALWRAVHLADAVRAGLLAVTYR